MSRIPAVIALATAVAFVSPASAQSNSAAAPSESSVPNTRPEVIRALEARFASVDSNKDGSLSSAELQVVEAQTIARQKAELSQVIDRGFAKLDTNRDGSLSLAEYRAAAPTVASKPAENAATLIKLLDADKNGTLSGDEFKRRTLAVFDRLDANKDGTVTADERRKAIAAANAGR